MYEIFLSCFPFHFNARKPFCLEIKANGTFFFFFFIIEVIETLHMIFLIINYGLPPT
jgi:hypothetical protein